MKILMVDKWFRKTQASSKYFFGLRETFLRHGHTVVDFSMKDPRNVPSAYEGYFVDFVDFNEPASVVNHVQNAVRAVYSFEARAKLDQLLEETRPNVAFLFNIYHHLSPSILYSLKKAGVPVVMLLADYNLICPSYRLLAHGVICERCKSRKFWHALEQRCFKGSALRSAAAAGVAYLHDWSRVYQTGVDRFIAGSEFTRRKFVEFGWPAERIIHVPHSLPDQGFAPNYALSDYIVYVGALESWKGIATLVHSMSHVPTVKLVVVGGGSQRQALDDMMREKGLNNVHFAGYLSDPEMFEVVRNAQFAVVPSEWYEVYGTVIWEAFAFGKPVVGSRIGGIPELVQPGRTGLLFEPGNIEDLAQKIRVLAGNPELVVQMGTNARRVVEEELTMEINYAKTMMVFEEAMAHGSVKHAVA